MVDDPTPEQLALQLQTFFDDQPAAVLLEDGRILFDLRLATATVAAEHGHCVLHVWSEERNCIRHVVGIAVRKSGLRLHVLRMGQTKPQTMELQPQQRRLPSQRDSTRSRYIPLLERLLPRHFPDFKVEGLRTAMDLERSFGPSYARGTLVCGNAAWALIAINEDESQSLIDGILTLGVLWLHHCREHSGGRRLVEGLRLILPRGKSTVTAARLAWMNLRAAKWELYELDEKTEELYRREYSDQGNFESRLVHAPNTAAAEERFHPAIQRVQALLPAHAVAHMEVAFRSGSEVGLLWNGLEFARVRTSAADNSFARSEEILFGSGANATHLTEDSAPKLREIVAELVARRQPSGDKRDTLYRQQPERWLESMLRRSLDSIDAMVEPQPVYAQVPAFSAADRAVLDLLAVRRDGRLVVIEIKADEDLHLALQSLDYWVRVRQHHRPIADRAGSPSAKSDLERFGYFPGKQLRADAPLLYLIAPALRIHPATEVVLRYVSPEVDWTLIALDERWREKVRVVFRKRREK
ncbi:MAG: nuclease/transposase family protein [Acidobacteriaceae bacterium]